MMAWTGFGWLAFALIIGVFFGNIHLSDLLFGPGFARQNPLPVCASSWVASSLLCWPVGRYFNRSLPLRVFDSDWAWKGRTDAHSAFFVRLEFAGLVGLPFHLLMALKGLDWLDGR